MKIFFDLDGTLINSQTRMYELFNTLVKESNFTYDQYWTLKRNRLSHEFILENIFKYDESRINMFSLNWMNEIEKKKWLLKDYLVDDCINVLQELFQRYDLYIVTARQKKDNTIEQLKDLNILHFFKKIYITERLFSKYSLISKDVLLNENDVLVGDTGEDIVTGKDLNIRTVAVSQGFTSKEKLLGYSPNFIIDNIKYLNTIL